jgi:DNA polymerase-3 subunit beta
MPTHTKVQPKALGRALAAVKPALSRRAAIEALGGVRLTLAESGLQLEATDVEVFARATVAQVHDSVGDLDCLVAHRELAEVVKACADRPDVELSLQPGPRERQAVLACTSGQRTVRLQTLGLRDFPAHPAAGGRRLFTAAGGPLADAIERVARFASSDESRPVMCGINVDWDDGLRLIGCDSYRLAAIPAPAADRARKRKPSTRRPDPNRVTVDARGLLLAAKAMRRAEAVEVLECGGFAVLQDQTTRWTIQTIEGRYPRWQQLIPDQFPHTITIPSAELAQASEVARTFLGRSPARLLANGDVKLYGSAADGPEFEETLAGAEVQLDGTDTFEIGFNAEFLRSVALACQGGNVVMRLTGPACAAVIEDGENRFLLMPVKLG